MDIRYAWPVQETLLLKPGEILLDIFVEEVEEEDFGMFIIKKLCEHMKASPLSRAFLDASRCTTFLGEYYEDFVFFKFDKDVGEKEKSEIIGEVKKFRKQIISIMANDKKKEAFISEYKEYVKSFSIQK